MKKLLFSIFCVVAASGLYAQHLMTEGSVGTPSNGTVHFLYYLPGNYRSTGAGHPLIVSLGGVGERGDGSSADLQNLYVGGIPKKIHDSSNMVFTYTAGNGAVTTDGFIVIAPQLPKTSDWQNFYVDAVISYAKANFNVDASRVFLTGYSLGGVGTWNYATSSSNAGNLAGIIPIAAGYPGNTNYCNIANNKVAVWAFQGAADNVYGGGVANDITNQISNCAGITVPAFDSTFPNEVHGFDFWDNKVYSLTNNIQIPNVYQWMLRVNRNLLNLTPDLNPVATATMGGLQTLNLVAPVKVKNLPALVGSASYDPDDIIVKYYWEKLSGPAVILGSSAAAPTRENWPTTPVIAPASDIKMTQGNYQFRLTVKDYLTSKPGHTQPAIVNLNISFYDGVHSAPATDAGKSRSISVNEDRETGSWSNYTCPNCGQKAFQWSIVSQPAGANVQLRDFNNNTLPYSAGSTQAAFVNMSVPGLYKFEFAVTNQNNDVGRDTLTITRLGSVLPVSYAYIKGSSAGGKNTVSWATATEVNSDHFDIMRSSDGADFTRLGAVSAHGGATQVEYSFDDNNAPAGTSYYRLAQVDKDGHTTLSKIISINNRRAAIYVEHYPNPVHESLTVTVQGINNGSLHMVIADMQGKTILQQQWQKDQSLFKKAVNVASLQNGVYQIIITVGQDKQVSSFVKY